MAIHSPTGVIGVTAKWLPPRCMHESGSIHYKGKPHRYTCSEEAGHEGLHSAGSATFGRVQWPSEFAFGCGRVATVPDDYDVPRGGFALVDGSAYDRVNATFPPHSLADFCIPAEDRGKIGHHAPRAVWTSERLARLVNLGPDATDEQIEGRIRALMTEPDSLVKAERERRIESERRHGLASRRIEALLTDINRLADTVRDQDAIIGRLTRQIEGSKR